MCPAAKRRHPQARAAASAGDAARDPVDQPVRRGGLNGPRTGTSRSWGPQLAASSRRTRRIPMLRGFTLKRATPCAFVFPNTKTPGPRTSTRTPPTSLPLRRAWTTSSACLPTNAVLCARVNVSFGQRTGGLKTVGGGVVVVLVVVVVVVVVVVIVCVVVVCVVPVVVVVEHAWLPPFAAAATRSS